MFWPSNGYYISFPSVSLHFSCFPLYRYILLTLFRFPVLYLSSFAFIFVSHSRLTFILSQHDGTLSHSGSLHHYECFQAASIFAHVHSKQPAFTVLI